ncbi:anhydro-N-acetylmuramic acid kinase [Paenibacillus hemerocallicola]|uniref:Anhydro-N-acetylmuramic acid kinase n=1 Tax=Paenibacillus hemerocallicola TaxID=1172614 RepID=A0A5C4TCG4_9BACL|nr:anhydro-N-acetylmuramic acid kinase [Paenibacillus hemerocallicola]TNJ66625.1 anhydro-N-acetylmuramic acid kinase [Paenibacillus hemerocallicola]
MIANLVNKSSRLIIGLMSGTSLDGVDAAIVRVEGNGPDTKAELVGYTTVPYDDKLREKLKELCSVDHSDVAKVCGMNFYIADVFADAAERAAKEAGLTMTDIDLVSSHGQTIWHIPVADEHDWSMVRSTLQIGDISVIAKRTGKPVVGDYRTADMAVGGQGAPLVPYADFILFRDEKKGRILQNIGGIGNCAAIPAGGLPEQIVAFDTGPGNMLIDQAVHTLSGGAKSYDAGGEWAAQGDADEAVVAEMMSHPYFAMQPPKTTGREVFGKAYAHQWIGRMRDKGLSDADIVATFTAFTAHSISQSYREFVLPVMPVEEVIVSGGGAHNRTLLAMIAELHPGLTVTTSDKLGISSDAKEAVAFAIFANNFLFGIPNNLPSATGAPVPTIMGKLALPG